MGVKKSPKKDAFIAIHFKTAIRALKEIFRKPLGNGLTLAVIAMALSLPACLYLVGKNVAMVADNVTSPAAINAYVEEGSAEAKVILLKDQIERLDQVESVEYVSSQQGIAELSEHAGFEEAISLLDDYALPAVLVIYPKSDSPSAILDLMSSLKEMGDISDIRVDEDWLERFDAIKVLATTVSVALAIVMLVAVILIVGNTMRYNVLAQRDEIQVMKFIGATNSYILRPYLYAGMWFGLLGAVFAWVVTAVLTVMLNGVVESLAALYDSQFRLFGLYWDESLILLLLGAFLGLFASSVSAKRHLKEIEPV
jgi:cell division transport system permease protein